MYDVRAPLLSDMPSPAHEQQQQRTGAETNSG